MQIGDWDSNHDVLIIAEIGNNHEGSYTLAEEMIGLAAKTGADAVKFQTIIPEKLVSCRETERMEQLRKFQLTYQEYQKLAKVAAQESVLFLSTPFDIESAKFLDDLVPIFKISSGDNNFYPLIEVIARTGKPIFLSTGFMEIEEIRKSAHFVRGFWNENSIEQELALLHCVSLYPTPPTQANLRAIEKLRGIVPTVGYSDHTLGIDAAVLSVALGARIIEKHFTLNKDYSDFRDHSLSADPKEMKELVDKIRCANRYLGNRKTNERNVEKTIIRESRRSIVSSRDLIVGDEINLNDLDWVRPGGGLSPGSEGKLLGKRLIKNIKKGEIIYLEDVN